MPKPSKPAKLSKKKATTITDLATSAYRPPPTLPDAAHVTAYFFPSAADVAAEPSKKRKRAKPKKAEPVASKLLSPKAAISRSTKQEFLFGTSSQLASEEPASYIRDLQQATAESEALGGTQSTFQGLGESYASVPTAPHGTGLSVGQGNKNLWSKGARDDRVPSAIFSGIAQTTEREPPEEVDQKEVGAAVSVEYDALTNSPYTSLVSKQGRTQTRQCRDALGYRRPTSVEDVSRRSVQTDLCQRNDNDSPSPSPKPGILGPRDPPKNPRTSPDPAGMLSGHILSRMGRRRFGLDGTDEPHDDWALVDDIVDLEATATPSPPRRGVEALALPLPALALAGKPDAAPGVAAPAADVFLGITRAVKADRGWYVRVLMYEPVVVEDLAAWLGLMGVLGFSGKAAEVKVVKEWCDLNGVCCVNKEGRNR
ncbi:5'-flap endonuclease [Elasticomyces elasticus]|nr:5'-flap endonuclease [Elasticomyces elasticus]